MSSAHEVAIGAGLIIRRRSRMVVVRGRTYGTKYPWLFDVEVYRGTWFRPLWSSEPFCTRMTDVQIRDAIACGFEVVRHADAAGGP